MQHTGYGELVAFAQWYENISRILTTDQLEAILITHKKPSAGQVPALADAIEAQELR